MVRPKDSSHQSYNLILGVLAEEPRSFEDLWKLTGLHRNTVSSRLKYLVSRGLVGKTRVKHKVVYAIVEPINFDRWNELSYEIMKEFGKRRLMKVIREWMNTEAIPGLTKLENLPESQNLLKSQELSELFPEWKELSLEDYYSMLKLNFDLTENLICPECFHFGTVEDPSTKETICPICGYVLGDDPIPLKERVEAISYLLKNKKDES